MIPSEIAPVVIAIVALAAFVLSIYNTLAQRRDARKQDERWEREKRPNLTVGWDSRLEGPAASVNIYSLRIVNGGGVPVEIRSMRIAPPNGPSMPMPKADDDVKAHLWESEKAVGEGLPHILPPGLSVRFATRKDEMEAALERAGFTGLMNYEVEVEDALSNTYRTQTWAALGKPPLEP